MISADLFRFLLWLHFEYWIICQLYRFKCNSAATVYVLLKCSCGLVFLLTLLEFLLSDFFPGIFSPWPKKKDIGKKALKKIFAQIQSKISVYIVCKEKKLYAVYITPIIPTENLNDSYKLMSLGDLSLVGFSGRPFLELDFSFLLIFFFEILNRTFGKERKRFGDPGAQPSTGNKTDIALKLPYFIQHFIDKFSTGRKSPVFLSF